ncbi:MAG: FIG01122115: hypothetical protein [uncultured Nocardioidaceae bacterium]|uniref:DUF3710 domain-containing protein n=1 Tax=uncultured Nocardioidaceae bacterium TaxID=253824 RepID=A0A6J4LSJ6_9ACTN|nr:MAG: FIG01122115: hypothetical protein [uncultured Nocardioidaceae bacterium]
MRWSRRSATQGSGDTGSATDPTTGPATHPAADAPVEAADAGAEGTGERRPDGPWDVSERPRDEDDARPWVDLGALSLPGHPDVQVQLQVDEASGEVAAVLLVAEDGAMELRAFAAPRNEDIWDDVRTQLAAEAKRRGGDTREVQGPYGTVLQMVVPVVTPEGEQAAQQSAVLGIAGPRWLLRASMYGRPAREWRPNGLLESLLRDVVVDRGSQPMTPGQALPLRLPAGAQRVEAPAP